MNNSTCLLPTSNVPLTIGLSFLCAVCIGLGFNLQKASYASKAWFRVLWMTGFVFLLGACATYYGAIVSVGEIVATPIFNVVIPLNFFLAPLVVGEKPQRWRCSSTILIMLGCSLMVLGWFPQGCDPSEIIQDRAVIYAALCVAAMTFSISCMLRSLYYIRSKQDMQYAELAPYLVFAYSNLPANLFSNAGVLALVIDMDPSRLPYSAVVAIFTLVCLILLNIGFKMFESQAMVPIFCASVVTFNILGGGLVFDEFANFDIFSTLVFMLGFCINIVGTFFLVKNTEYIKVETMEEEPLNA